jgi:hypothetical protein
MTSRHILMIFAALCVCAPQVPAQGGDRSKQPARAETVSVPFFGNKTCPIEGQPAKRELSVDVEGQQVHVCDLACIRKVQADPKAALAKAYPADKLIDLANQTCPIKLGQKVKQGFSVTWQGYRVHLCCRSCMRRFGRSPGLIITQLRQPGLKVLGNAKCPSMPEEDVLPDLFVIYRDTIVNICCDSCADEIRKDPVKILGKLVPAPASPPQGGEGDAPGSGH